MERLNLDHITTMIDDAGRPWKRHPDTGNGLVSPYFRRIGTRIDRTIDQLLKGVKIA